MLYHTWLYVPTWLYYESPKRGPFPPMNERFRQRGKVPFTEWNNPRTIVKWGAYKMYSYLGIIS